MRSLLSIALALLFAATALAAAYDHGGGGPPAGGSIPDHHRASADPPLDVCLTTIAGQPECAYTTIQGAVNAARDGDIIQVWPGLYAPAAGDVGGDLVLVSGKHDITIRGMGDASSDVVIDARFQKDIVVHGHAADGLVLQNFDVWHGNQHGVFVDETDGIWLDHVSGFMSSSYELFYFAVDHGVMRDCEAVGGGDSGVYLGGLALTPGRYSVELTRCVSHHNVLGYSGTDGNFAWIHDNEFYDNSAGVVSDSETNHPNYPQRNATIENNWIHDNNYDVYDGTTSDIRPENLQGIIIPVGTGLFLPTSNNNTVRGNTFANNHAVAMWLASGQGIVVGPTSTPMQPPAESSGNRVTGNALDGNGVDFMWDGLGTGDCWQGNVRSDGAAPTTDMAVLPPCDVAGHALPTTVSAPNAADLGMQLGLVIPNAFFGSPVSDALGPNGDHPLCFTSHVGPCEGGQFTTADWPTHGKNRSEGMEAPPAPPTCGPSGPIC